jgi:hypothetical protein
MGLSKLGHLSASGYLCMLCFVSMSHLSYNGALPRPLPACFHGLDGWWGCDRGGRCSAWALVMHSQASRYIQGRGCTTAFHLPATRQSAKA